MRRLNLLLCLLFAAQTLFASPAARGFAIVVDSASYAQAKPQIEAYAAEIERSGLKVYTVIDCWGVPDSLRSRLIELHADKKAPIEGAVFMGDIPIPMIRDAQHMTSAFKMNQKTFDKKQSSVPSDRFYDDFSLEFRFIERDEDIPDYFYYSLTETSAQRLCPDIYSGRIRPTDCGGTSRYEKLRAYLEKVVAEKRSANTLDQVLYFSGHGFISESMMARIDEKAMLLDHFPWLNKQKNGISYIDHSQQDYIKFTLMNEMQREDLDYAVLHHHGDWDTQYLNNLPLHNYAADEIASVKLYLRESLRHAAEHGKNLDTIKVKLMTKFDVPEHWFDGAFDAQQRAKDSIHLYNLDLYLSDFDNYHPAARLVVLDACFNGSFHRDNSIANAYIFNPGKTIAVVANSVNVLQDKWIDRYVGLVGMGMRVGNLVKYGPYLEAHVIGDPTFTFKPSVDIFDLNDALASGDAKVWKKAMKSPYPAVRTMAIEQLFRAGKLSSDDLLEIFKTSKYGIVRVQALVSLSECRDDNFVQALNLAVGDSYEMVERFGMNMIATCGDERLIPALISAAIRNNTTERIEFGVKQALPMFETDKLMAEFERQFDESTNYMDSEKVKAQIAHAIEYNSKRWIEDMNTVISPDAKPTSRMNNIRSMRNYHVHFMVPQLLEYMKNCGDEQTQIDMLEAFGWFRLSYRAPEIAAVAEAMSRDESYGPKVRAEALKTYNRLK